MTATHTTLKVSKELTEKLKQFGMMGDTYEDVIWRLLEFYQSNHGKPLEPIVPSGTT
jgi:hypothetical protein